MDLERNIDGAIGRMLSWLTLAPTHARGARAPATPPADAASEPAVAVTEALAQVVEEVAEAPTAEPMPAEPSLEEEILAALSASEDGTATAELRRRTGAEPATLRARLNRLIAGGRVQRKGQGMRTRYHLVTAGKDDG